MKTIREWGFPAGLLIAWIIASVYTTSALISANAEHRHLLNPAAASSPQT